MGVRPTRSRALRLPVEALGSEIYWDADDPPRAPTWPDALWGCTNHAGEETLRWLRFFGLV
jgi:hypothetical protein